jgi:type VI protein secretion system component VasF
MVGTVAVTTVGTDITATTGVRQRPESEGYPLTEYQIAVDEPQQRGSRAMDLRTFSVTAGAIFALIALVHLLRIYLGWSIVIDSWSVPIWVSWIGFVVAGGLAYLGLRAIRRQFF